jgi:hypothetical protein
MKTPFPPNVQRALDDGELWRARDALRGRLARRFDPSLYEQLGCVLLKMGDDLEAGKYLFLSGERAAEYTKPIELFLGRYKTRGSDVMWACPKAVRRLPVDSLPPAVQEELRSRKISDRHWRTMNGPQDEPMSRAGCLLRLLVIVLLGLFVATVFAAIMVYGGWVKRF